MLIEADYLFHATEVAREHAKHAVFAYDAETIRNIIEALRHEDVTRE